MALTVEGQSLTSDMVFRGVFTPRLLCPHLPFWELLGREGLADTSQGSELP